MDYRKRWRVAKANIAAFLTADYDSAPTSIVLNVAVGRTDVNAAKVPSLSNHESHLLASLPDDSDDNDFNDLNFDDWLYDYCSDEESDITSEPAAEAGNDDEQADSLIDELADWAAKNRISHLALGSLLKILSPYHKELPIDPRTLLKTPRKVKIVDMCGGKFVYFGVEAGILRSLAAFKPIADSNSISLSVGVDGLPLFKSTYSQFWPILCKYDGVQPFLVALYYGNEKPKSVDDYLNELLQELKLLQVNGVHFNDRHISDNVSNFICDAPARAFLKCTKIHNAYHGCDRCTTKGQWDG
jgi:hypothetical protein